MNKRDERLGVALRSLDVPRHGPEFHARLAERLGQEPARHSLKRRPTGWRRPPMLLVALAAVLVTVFAVSTMLKANRPPVVVEAGGGNKTSTTVSSQTTLANPDRPTTTAIVGPTILARPAPTTSTTRPGMSALTSASTLDVGGLGPVRVGMTPAEATAAAGIPVVASGTAGCSYATAAGGPAGVAFKLANGRISRVEVRPGSPVKTLSGAGVGDTEADVQARYSNSLEVTGHKYLVGGHYLTLVPTDAADKDSRLIFETDGTKVTTFQAGTLPEVALVEGCG